MAHVVLCVDFDFDREPEGISVLIREFGETELSPPSASLMAFNRNGGAGSTNITCSKDCRTFAVTLLLKPGHIRLDGESVLLEHRKSVLLERPPTYPSFFLKRSGRTVATSSGPDAGGAWRIWHARSTFDESPRGTGVSTPTL